MEAPSVLVGSKVAVVDFIHTPCQTATRIRIRRGHLLSELPSKFTFAVFWRAPHPRLLRFHWTLNLFRSYECHGNLRVEILQNCLWLVLNFPITAKRDFKSKLHFFSGDLLLPVCGRVSGAVQAHLQQPHSIIGVVFFRSVFLWNFDADRHLRLGLKERARPSRGGAPANRP